jgi:hypothetical protein
MAEEKKDAVKKPIEKDKKTIKPAGGEKDELSESDIEKVAGGSLTLASDGCGCIALPPTYQEK